MRRLLPVLLVAWLVPAAPSDAAAAGPARAPLITYRGLGTWVDIYEAFVWNHPKRAVRKMDRKGVRTLYLGRAGGRPG